MPDGRFAAIVAGDPYAVPLDLATAEIAAALRPQVEPSSVLAGLDELAAACAEDTAEGIARFLFGEDGFRGNQASYYDWRNSCLDQVLERRRGIPITLSIVFIEVARRRGVALHGVGMPAHFLVGVTGSPGRFFDPFHGPGELDADGAKALLRRVTDGGIEWHDGYLAPIANRHVVIRVLNNLRSIFAGEEDELRLAVVSRLRAAVPELAATESAALDRSIARLN